MAHMEVSVLSWDPQLSFSRHGWPWHHDLVSKPMVTTGDIPFQETTICQYEMGVWDGNMRWEYTLSEYDIVYIIHYILYIHNNIRTWICPWRRYPLKLWRFTVEKWPAKAMGRQFTRLRHPKHLSVSTCQDFLLKNAVRIWCNTKWFTQFPVFHIQLHNYI